MRQEPWGKPDGEDQNERRIPTILGHQCVVFEVSRGLDMERRFPSYTFVPGGPWPHPVSDPRGHAAGRHPVPAERIVETDWSSSVDFLHALNLFNAGYYWEAHEVWERLWHAHRRTGPTAEVLKGLIKLAAAGVKVRQGQRHGVVTHCERAARQFEVVIETVGETWLGLDLRGLVAASEQAAADPPTTRLVAGDPAADVLGIQLKPAG